MSTTTPRMFYAATDMECSTSGALSIHDREYAMDKIGKAISLLGAPVLHADIRIEVSTDPARERPVMARVTLDLDGRPVRAHVWAHTVAEAVDLLENRLRDRLHHIADHERALRRRGPDSPDGEWRHGDPRTARPPVHPRPVEEREVLRHKTFSTDEATIDEAVFDLESMDYDFFLFTDLASGRDALVHRASEGVYCVQHVDGSPFDPSTPTAAAIEVVERPAPQLSLAAARERLDLGEEPWVFFEDEDTHRGRVLYRRYDGHYGVITPTTS